MQVEILGTMEEKELYCELLSFNNKQILELGCGQAEKTLDIAERGENCFIIASEVDPIQSEKNRESITQKNFLSPWLE